MTERESAAKAMLRSVRLCFIVWVPDDLLECESSPGCGCQIGFAGDVVDEAGGFVAPILAGDGLGAAVAEEDADVGFQAETGPGGDAEVAPRDGGFDDETAWRACGCQGDRAGGDDAIERDGAPR